MLCLGESIVRMQSKQKFKEKLEIDDTFGSNSKLSDLKVKCFLRMHLNIGFDSKKHSKKYISKH